MLKGIIGTAVIMFIVCLIACRDRVKSGKDIGDVFVTFLLIIGYGIVKLLLGPIPIVVGLYLIFGMEMRVIGVVVLIIGVVLGIWNIEKLSS